jgi:hypothetical protein
MYGFDDKAAILICPVKDCPCARSHKPHSALCSANVRKGSKADSTKITLARLREAGQVELVPLRGGVHAPAEQRPTTA